MANGRRHLGTNPGKYHLAGISGRCLLIQQLQGPLRANRQRIDFQREARGVDPGFDVPRFLGFVNCADQGPQPLAHGANDGSPDWAGPAVEFERSSSKKAATGEHLFLYVTDPAVAQLPETGNACRLSQRGTYYVVNENAPRHLDRGQLQITLRTEVREKTALAHFQGFREVTDREAFQALNRGQIHSDAQNALARPLALPGSRAAVSGTGHRSAKCNRKIVIARTFVFMPYFDDCTWREARDMRRYGFLLLLFAMVAAPVPAQEIRLETCDKLPVAEVSISGAKFLFLVDTAATSFLNSKSFAPGPELQISVTSWSGTTETRAQQVTIGDLALGGRHLSNLRLPAVDLSAIGRACGRRLDGVFGIDLLRAFGASVVFDGGSARLLVPSDDAHDRLASFDREFVACDEALGRGDESGLAGCLDQQVVLSTAGADLFGRGAVVEFLKEKYRTRDPSSRLSMTIRSRHILGEGIWTEYDLRVAVLDRVVVQRGSALWHEIDGRWSALYVNHSGPPRKESRDTSN